MVVSYFALWTVIDVAELREEVMDVGMLRREFGGVLVFWVVFALAASSLSVK